MSICTTYQCENPKTICAENHIDFFFFFTKILSSVCIIKIYVQKSEYVTKLKIYLSIKVKISLKLKNIECHLYLNIEQYYYALQGSLQIHYVIFSALSIPHHLLPKFTLINQLSASISFSCQLTFVVNQLSSSIDFFLLNIICLSTFYVFSLTYNLYKTC